MFVKRSAPKGVRKRPNPSDAAADQQGETAASPAAPGGAAGTEGEAISAAAATAAAARSDGSDEEHAKIARRKQPRTNICKHFLVGRTKTKASEREKITNALAQESNPDLKLDDDARATARLDVDTDKSIDYRAILERNILISKKIANGELDGGIYRGMGAYRKYVLPKEGAISRNKITGLYGPSRSNNSNVRLTMYIDYKPEICKDYKETGYCGYGDCCKFLHDRTDYKEGWQVDKEWEELQKKKLDRLRRQAEGEEGVSSCSNSSDDSDEEEEDDDGLPFACLSCRKKWVISMNPVVTPCGHYFCEECAINNYKKNKLCVQCGVDTGGILNCATKLINKIQAKSNNNNDNNNDSSNGTAQQTQGNSNNSSSSSNSNNNNKNTNDSDDDSSSEEGGGGGEEEEEEE